MDLTHRSSHFEFGENWLSYSRTIDDERIARAEQSLQRLLQVDLRGKSFLDIGSGSGLFSLAAMRLGARPVHAIDIDENSVAASRQLLEARAPTSDWRVENIYHTGDMWRAIEQASRRVAAHGHLALALYRKTYLCPVWTIEKRLYAKHPRTFAPIANLLFKGAWVSAQLLLARNPLARIRSYHSTRGMSWSHDVHDWLGGHPYESTSFDELVSFVTKLGFVLTHTNARQRKTIGALGSGCDEYVFSRS
jgi:2-polyprenyl-6-hydroxyphenyl methylase/3-demethylubiquinone-9 3-methyltransferase